MALIRDLGNQLRQTTSIGGVQADVYGGLLIARPGDTPMVAPADGGLAIQPIGSTGNQALDLIQGLDGIITKQQMALREADRIARDLSTVAERTAKFYGDTMIRSQQNAASLEGFTQGSSYMGSGVPVAPPAPPRSDHGHRVPEAAEVAPGTPPGPWDDTTPSGYGPGDRPTSRGGWVEPQGPGRPRPGHEEGWHAPQSWAEGRQMGGMSLSSIRQNAARGMSQRLSEWNMGANIAQDAHGQWHYAAGEEVDGVKVGGRFVGEEAALHAQRLRAVSGGVKNFVAGVAEDGSLSSGLGAVSSTAGKALGYAAVAWTAGNKMADFAEDQRRQNLQYQAVLGGSNAEGFKERLGAAGFRWTQRGVMGEAEAARLYEGALDIYGAGEGGGFDTMRTRAQDVGTELYRQAGMGPDESLRFFRTASKHGSEALEELGQALLATTKAARQAGINAKEARDNFEKIYQTTAQYGAAGAAAAGATATAQANMGEQFQSWDFTGLQGRQQTYMLAGMLGTTPNEVLAMRTSAGGQMKLTEAQQQMFQKQFSNVFDAEGWEIIRSKGSTIYSDEQWTELAKEMIPHFQGDIWATADLLRAQGWPVPDGRPEDNVVPIIVMFLKMLITEDPLNAKDPNLRDQAGAENRAEERLKGGGPRTEAWSPEMKSGGKDSQAWKDYFSDLGIKEDEIEMSPEMGPQGKNARANAAIEYSKITMNNQGDERLGAGRNFVAEDLIRSAYDEEGLYIVNTADGPREVNFNELMLYYRDQVETGDVWISQGKFRGKSVATALGIDQQGEGEDTQSAKTDPGRTGAKVDSFQTTRDSEGGDRIHIQIGLDPNAKGLITATADPISNDQRSGSSSGTSTNPNTRPGG